MRWRLASLHFFLQFCPHVILILWIKGFEMWCYTLYSLLSPNPLLSVYSRGTKVDCVHLCFAGSDCLPFPNCSEGPWDVAFCSSHRQVSVSVCSLWTSAGLFLSLIWAWWLMPLVYHLPQVSDLCHVCHHAHSYQSNCGAQFLLAQSQHSYHVPNNQTCK